MTSFKFALCAILGVALLSCGKKDGGGNFTIAGKSTTSELGATKLSEHIESIKIVPLETNDSLLIGRIDAIKVRESQIYALSSRTLYHFDPSGRLVSQINLVGSGPGEVTMVTDFDIADGYCYVMAPGKIVVRNISNPADFREIATGQSGGRIRKINDGILASFNQPLTNGNGVMLFAESGDTICSLLSAGNDWSIPRTLDFIEYQDGEYIHPSMGNDIDVIVPAEKQTYKITFVENDDALSTDEVGKELPKAKSKTDVSGEIYMGLTPSKNHLMWMGIDQDKMSLYLYNRMTGQTIKFDATALIDDISGAPDISQNMMLGMLAFNDSDNDCFVSVIDPNATHEYITETPNKFSESYQPLDSVAPDANPAVILIRFR
ncbi:MAG: 6-bladed beta-propeller [Muribaculaceae bacterium]|nr:6-bladed beta-propeller [Muribaculaceae bacterium]